MKRSFQHDSSGTRWRAAAGVLSITLMTGAVHAAQPVGTSTPTAAPAATTAPVRGAKLVFTIQVKVPGASTLTVEREVMRPLEASMRTILGIRGVRSTAQIGVLKTRLEFDAGVDAEKIATTIRQRLSDLKRRWPPRAAELVSWGRETTPIQ